MRVGVILPGAEVAELSAIIPACEEGGLWGIGFGFSPGLYADPFVQATMAAMRTSRLRIGPWVLNPRLQHPVVTARALHTIAEVSGGRAFLGIGTGDSAVRNAGLNHASTADLETYVTCVRQLLSRGQAAWQGAEVRFSAPPVDLPILVAASGPRTLEMAGRIGDGVIVGTGVDARSVEEAMTAIGRGARAGGRSLEALRIWWPVVVNIATSDEVAVEAIKHTLATFAHFSLRTPASRNGLPPRLEGPVLELLERYDSLAHADDRRGLHAQLIDELGLTDYLLARFAVAGTPSTVIDRVRRLEERGVENLWLSIRLPDRLTVLQRWLREVAPSLA